MGIMTLTELNAIPTLEEQIQKTSTGLIWNKDPGLKYPKLNIESITYGLGKYVAVGNGVCMTSTNGTNWYTCTMAPGYYKSVTYNNKIFVAVGAYVCATSTNGVDWVTRAIEPSDYTKVEYNATLGFVAIGNKKMSTSSNGINWTYNTILSNPYFNDMCHDNGTYIAVGNDGLGAISIDGVTWAKLNMQTTEHINSLVYGKGKWIAFTNNYFITSTNGIDWVLTAEGYQGHSSFFNGSKFVVAGNGRFYYSTNGTSWSGTAYFGFGPITGFCTNGNTWVASYAHYLYVSTDNGVTWTSKMLWKYNNINDYYVSQIYGVCYYNNMYIIVGAGGIYYTTDLLIFTMIYDSGKTIYDVIVKDGIFYAIGDSTFLTSTDGTSWINISLSGVYIRLAYGTRGLIALTRNTCLTSIDGKVWSNNNMLENVVDFTYNGTYIGVGSNLIYVSTNGTSWVRKSVLNGEYTKVITGAANKVYALGDASLIVSSDNGNTWSAVAGFPTTKYNDIIYNGVFYLAIGASGILKSTDGVTWTESYVYPGDYNDLIYVNNSFTCIGDQAISRLNSSGDWKSYYGPDGIVKDLIYFGGAYVAVGDSYVVTSTDITTWVTSSAPIHNYVSAFIDEGMLHLVYEGGVVSTVDLVTWVDTTVTITNILKAIPVPNTINKTLYLSSNGLYLTNNENTYTIINVSRAYTDVIYFHGLCVVLFDNTVLVSGDLVNWNTVNLPTGTYTKLVASESTLLIVGDKAVSTNDGISWTVNKTFDKTINDIIYVFGFGFIAVGDSYCTVSLTGLLWMDTYIPTGVYTKIMFGGASLIALGPDIYCASPIARYYSPSHTLGVGTSTAYLPLIPSYIGEPYQQEIISPEAKHSGSISIGAVNSSRVDRRHKFVDVETKTMHTNVLVSNNYVNAGRIHEPLLNWYLTSRYETNELLEPTIHTNISHTNTVGLAIKASILNDITANTKPIKPSIVVINKSTLGKLGPYKSLYVDHYNYLNFLIKTTTIKDSKVSSIRNVTKIGELDTGFKNNRYNNYLSHLYVGNNKAVIPLLNTEAFKSRVMSSGISTQMNPQSGLTNTKLTIGRQSIDTLAIGPRYSTTVGPSTYSVSSDWRYIIDEALPTKTVFTKVDSTYVGTIEPSVSYLQDSALLDIYVVGNVIETKIGLSVPHSILDEANTYSLKVYAIPFTSNVYLQSTRLGNSRVDKLLNNPDDVNIIRSATIANVRTIKPYMNDHMVIGKPHTSAIPLGIPILNVSGSRLLFDRYVKKLDDVGGMTAEPVTSGDATTHMLGNDDSFTTIYGSTVAEYNPLIQYEMLNHLKERFEPDPEPTNITKVETLGIGKTISVWLEQAIPYKDNEGRYIAASPYMSTPYKAKLLLNLTPLNPVIAKTIIPTVLISSEREDWVNVFSSSFKETYNNGLFINTILVSSRYDDKPKSIYGKPITGSFSSIPMPILNQAKMMSSFLANAKLKENKTLIMHLDNIGSSTPELTTVSKYQKDMAEQHVVSLYTNKATGVTIDNIYNGTTYSEVVVNGVGKGNNLALVDTHATPGYMTKVSRYDTVITTIDTRTSSVVLSSLLDGKYHNPKLSLCTNYSTPISRGTVVDPKEMMVALNFDVPIVSNFYHYWS